MTTEYIDATFLKNHDQNRILSELGDDQKKMRVAAGILMTLPGTPYLYYGEEIGMKGRKPDEYIREPFIWDSGTGVAMQTSWEEPKYSTEQTVTPLSKQMNDPQSLYNFYKKLIHYRNGSKTLTLGAIDNTKLDIVEVVSFKRRYEEDELLILNNVSDVEVTIHLTGENEKFDAIDYDASEAATLNNGELRIPAYSTLILK